ncbi:unnamed protein product, partial [Brachionus calyciflorus]
MIRCAFLLMNRRRTKDYEQVLESLLMEAKKHNLVLNPKKVMTDFEIAAIKAFSNKKLVNLGFKTDYEENKEFNCWFRRIFSLAIIPINQIDTQSQIILDTQPVFEEENKAKNLEKFLDYLVDNYFEGRFPIELWNHFDSEGPRTNNNLEAYNNKLNQSAAFLKYQHALIGKPVPPRKKLQIFKDEQMRSYKKMFLENDLTLDAYI